MTQRSTSSQPGHSGNNSGGAANSKAAANVRRFGAMKSMQGTESNRSSLHSSRVSSTRQDETVTQVSPHRDNEVYYVGAPLPRALAVNLRRAGFRLVHLKPLTAGLRRNGVPDVVRCLASVVRPSPSGHRGFKSPRRSPL